MDQKKRIGVYGGTFDPVHNGHVEVARKVSQLFEINEVVFVPARLAPHKLTRSVTSPLHRYAMLALATQSDSRLIVSKSELEAGDSTYTVDTLSHFKSQLPEGTELFFIMGSDSWAEINTWRNWQTLLNITSHIVVTRPHFDLRTDHVPETVKARIVDLRGARELPASAKQEGPGTIFFTDVVMKDISATDIRRAASANELQDLEKVVPEVVAQYIRKYGLYREWNET